MNSKVLDQLQSEAAEHRMIRRLASALQAAYRISDGDQLVAVLGTGVERNNREALVTWVDEQLPDLDEANSRQLLQSLVTRLGHALCEWEAQT